MSLTCDADLLRWETLRDLIAESLKLWGVEATVTLSMVPAPQIIVSTEAAEIVVRPGRAGDKLIRWTLEATAPSAAPAKRRPRTSVLGVLRGLRAELGAADSVPRLRLGVPIAAR